MPKHVEISTRSGRRYQLVSASDVLELDQDGAAALLRTALAEDTAADTIRKLAAEHGLDPDDRDELVHALARELASGGLVAIAGDEDANEGTWIPPDVDDWDDLPSLSDLRVDRTGWLAVEVVDYTGLPYAELELTVRDASGEPRRVMLDDRGRWQDDQLPGPGAAAIELPSRMELPPPLLRERPVQGFAAGSGDLRVSRQPTGSLSVRLDASHRIVVQPPTAHPTASFPGTLFASESAFPGPGIAHLVKYVQELTDRDPDARIGIFGHTDTTDDVDANKHLADRRAQSAYAILTGDYPLFAAVADAEAWPMACYQTMLRVLGCNPGAIDGEPGTQTDLAVAVFRRDYNRDAWHDEGRARMCGSLPDGDELDAATEHAIVDAYHAEMSGRIAPERFLGPKHAGCGELNPLADAHPQNRRVTLAIYGADAPGDAEYPCRAGDASACQVDEGGGFRCRFYRERIREQSLPDQLFPFWDFEWLRTQSGKAHVSALTHLADTNEACFVVRRARPDSSADDAGRGRAPTEGLEVATLAGLIRNGVAYALWDFGEVDPFAAERWFVELDPTSLLREYAPYVFTVAAHGAWGRADPPSYALERMSLSDATGAWAVGLAAPGDILLVAPGELAEAKHRRVSALRLPSFRTGSFQR